jgi:hypothetical protein
MAQLNFTLLDIVAVAIDILISGIFLWFTVTIFRGKVTLTKAVLFSTFMWVFYTVINLVIGYVPIYIPFLSLIIYSLLWFFIVTQFFRVDLVPAIAVALIQVVLIMVLPIIGEGTINMVKGVVGTRAR